MVLKLKLLLLLLLFVFCVTSQRQPPQQFSIGVIFDAEKTEDELAFRTAVDRANVNQRIFELIPIVAYTSTDDSFQMEKTVCKLIAQGVIAIFGPHTSAGSDIIASICNTLEIPHIVYDWSPNENIADRQHFKMTLNVYPDNLLLARGISEIVQSFDWRSFTIVYERDYHLQQMQEILQINEPTSNPTTIRFIGDTTDYRPYLKTIKLSSDNCLMIFCETENIMTILKQANDLKILGEYQSLFIPNLDMHTLDLGDIQNVPANITTVRIMDPTDYQLKNIALDWEQHEDRQGNYYRVAPTQVKTKMILINDAVWLFAKALTELGIDEEPLPAQNVECRRNRDWGGGRRIIEFMRRRSDEPATGRVDFNAYGQRNYFTLRFMELTHSGYLDLATWDPVNGLDLLMDDDASDKRVSEMISNKTFIITSRIGAPFLSHREPKDGEILVGNARYEGYSMDLIQNISQILNFRYEFRLVPDDAYGSYVPKTKSWNGLVKQLMDGNADLGICDLTMTSARRQVVDFTPPFMTLGISILYKKPEVPPPNLFLFLNPFKTDVWGNMGAAYVGVALLLYCLARMSPSDWENPHPCKEPEEVENAWTIKNTTWLSIGSIMGQGCDILPKAVSTRITTGLWWFFALMMTNSYTANLAAFMTSSRMDTSINSAEDLAAQSKIKYGAVTGGSTMGFFRDSNFSTYQRMWASMEEARPSVFTKSNAEGIDRILKSKGLYAFLMESTTLEYTIERNCDLMQVGGWLDSKTYGIAMPFNSPYRKQISTAVLKLGELGTLSEIKRKWWKEMHGGGACSIGDSGSSGDSPEMTLQNLGGVFLVLGLGLMCALIIGTVEFLWNIKAVAIEQKISLSEAFKQEAVFALKFWITTKPVLSSSDNSSSRSGSSGISHSKRSSKSLGLSATNSIKSGGGQNNIETVHEKLRKIGSLFSLKSLRSERDPAEVEAQMATDNSESTSKVDKGTQIEQENELKKRKHQHHQRKDQLKPEKSIEENGKK